jgi:hypothetical protein
MTSFFHDLEDQLRRAAQQRASGADVPGGAPAPPEPQRRRHRGWLAGGARALPALVAVAVALAVLLGALVLLGHRGGNPPTPPASGGLGAILSGQSPATTERELRYIAQATRSVEDSAACPQRTPDRVRLIHARPSPGLLGVLGVLRRRPTSADHLATHLLNAGAPVYAGYVRRAFHAAGASYYIYVQQDSGAEYPSDHCLTLQLDAVTRALPTIPAPMRGPTHTLETRLVAYERKLKAVPRQDTLCFAVQTHNGGSSQCGATLSQIENGVAPAGLGDLVSGVVPDGVASVTLRFPAGGGYPARTDTAIVHANVYVVRVPGAYSGDGENPTAIWHAADGRTLKVTTPPLAAAARRACDRHPVECLTDHGGTVERSASSSSTAAAPPTSHPKSGG